ncbi:hypothetical protein E8E13_000948 [Curvularia kusanoi]|uniref:Beta-fructofuranosidase n=1 Tax=Curvularia kusanoi TaxID=90978 RepID=A0A9P4W5F6_CURKU|nr:hypothetical protein E8E13_000948 [Curvularia kusanoi]
MSISSEPLWHPLPRFHLKAPYGWLNDPCGPGYDALSGTFHLFYQWNPKSCDWGDITWGHFTSKDGLRWTHNGSDPVFKPDMPYDKDGVFTGCLYPTGPGGEPDRLTIIYSSICYLPIHWSKPYKRNCAGLSAAVSEDGGHTWHKVESNPILAGEPEGLVMTGFRDPYLAEWPAMDNARGVEKKSLYGVVSGGVRDKGPAVFLYAAQPDNILSWEYLGPLIDFSIRESPSGRWGGDYGVNWECANFMTLADGDVECQFMTLGSEGGLAKGKSIEDQDPHVGWCMWMAGTIAKEENGAKFIHDFSGILDHGCFYAPSSYSHQGTRVVWGWLKEEDLTLAERESKGWTGYLSLPRELFLLRIPHVVGALKSPLEDIKSFKAVKTPGESAFTMQTLGIRPLSQLTTLRHSAPREWTNIRSAKGTNTEHLANAINWELEAIIDIGADYARIGFHVQHNKDMSQKTSIFFDPATEEIIVDRTCSNTSPDVRKDIIRGPFTLFTLQGPGEAERVEKLRLRIFGDGDVIEIFANDRFALSTMVYSHPSECTGVSCYFEGSDTGSSGAAFDG